MIAACLLCTVYYASNRAGSVPVLHSAEGGSREHGAGSKSIFPIDSFTRDSFTIDLFTIDSFTCDSISFDLFTIDSLTIDSFTSDPTAFSA